MRGICLLLSFAVGLLSGGAAVPTPPPPPTAGRLFCDDADVLGGVDLALVAHNAKLQHGNQLALYQVTEATKVVNESVTLIDLEFLVRASDCPAGGAKEWRDCDYLPQPDVVTPSPCSAVVYRSNAGEKLAVYSVECRPAVEALVVAKRVRCLGCREAIDVDSEDLREPVSYSLSKFNAEDAATHHFLLREIASATRQVVAGFRYDVHFDLEKSNCSKSDFKELTDECHPAEAEPEYARCNSTIYVAPWRREEPEAHVNCERILQMGFARRRPPGWSPLRHLNFGAEPPQPPRPMNPAPKLKGGVPRKESSEEEEAADAESRLDEPTPPAVDSEAPTPDPFDLLEFPSARGPFRPFNCPSKPWKQFVPLTPPPPPHPTLLIEPTESPEFMGESGGDFSDLDLLG